MKKKTIISVLSIGTILMTVTGISCKKHPKVQNAGDDVSVASTEDVVKQEETKVEFCTDGNCPCGDGFCAKNSVCIKDMCFCGAFPEKGFIDDGAVASNSFGEFECARFITEEECTIFNTEYDFICTRSEGCKIKDGRAFSFMDLSDSQKDSMDNGMYLIFDTTDLFYYHTDDYHTDDTNDANDPLRIPSNNVLRNPSNNVKSGIVLENSDKFVAYKDLIYVHRLNHCGKSLSEKLKYWISPDLSVLSPVFKYMDYNELVDEHYSDEIDRKYDKVEDFELPSDLECDLRQSCNDSGVTPEHIHEYVCEIGTKYFNKLCETTSRKRAIGLRCIQPEGCSCGNTQCPEYALCKDGTCTYDIYYQNRVCPKDADKSDIVNYKNTKNGCSCEEDYKYNVYCYNECWFHGSADNSKICEEFCSNDRCLSPEGCLCGNTNCDQYELCSNDGTCTYDVYSDFFICKKYGRDDCEITDDTDDTEDTEDTEDSDEEIGSACYEKCYWDDYDKTMTKTDPCKKSST